MPKLRQLVLREVCRDWQHSRSLANVPIEVAKLIWTEVKAQHARAHGGGALPCEAIYPFVRDVLGVAEMDLSDSGRWITAASLQALSYVRSLHTLRLTACRFVDDGALSHLRDLQLSTLDVSWSAVSDRGVQETIASLPSLTSLNLTGLAVSDRAVAALLPLTKLEKLALACTSISDASLDYLTYYSRYPDASTLTQGLQHMRWLELSNTRLTDTGVGKLVAIMEQGKPFGKVFKHLEYLALSMTSGVGPSAVRQVRTKYGFDAPLPNAQRTLAKSNAVALEAQSWVIRFEPTKERQLAAPTRTWEQARVLGYLAQYTKEMAAATQALARNGGMPPPADGEARPQGPQEKRPRHG